jgi:septal ring factor EnvC (AmiA/AmiB activator)
MIEQIIGYVVPPAVAAFLAWFFTRKKNQAEVETVVQDAKSKELDNIENAIEIWRKLAQDLKTELTEIKGQYKEIKQQNVELLDKLTLLEQDYKSLLDSYESLKKKRT